MQQIINFVIRNKTFLLFLLLFSIALSLTINAHSYHKSKFLNSSNTISGLVYGGFNSISKYFGLAKKNTILTEENTALKEQLYNLQAQIQSASTENFNTQYLVTAAQVYKNSYNKSNNYLTLNKGKKDSVAVDFGVVTSKGILGIVDKVSSRYCNVQSILSKKSSINAKLKNSNHIGSLTWNGKSVQHTQLEYISTFAPIKVGDTVVTGGQSAIFPKGIGIGTIASFNTQNNDDSYSIEVKLFNDMTNLASAYIINNTHKAELQALQNQNHE